METPASSPGPNVTSSGFRVQPETRNAKLTNVSPGGLILLAVIAAVLMALLPAGCASVRQAVAEDLRAERWTEDGWQSDPTPSSRVGDSRSLFRVAMPRVFINGVEGAATK
jgi:hypothetical protein